METIKKNLGFLIYSLNNGGAERQAAHLSKYLSYKYNIHILVLDPNNISYSYNGKLHKIGILHSSNFFIRIINFIKTCYKIYIIKKRYNLVVTISFLRRLNLYNVLTKTKNQRIIISIRNIESNLCNSIKSRYLIKFCSKKADMTVSVSEYARQDLIKNFSYDPNDVITIRNMYDMKTLQQTNPKIEKLTEEFDFSNGVIATVGRLEFQKAYWHLLRAFSILNKHLPKIKLVFFGQGKLEKQLKEYAKKLSINNNCFFMGYQNNHHAFLKKCDVFVLSSFFEGISNALLEAMALGLPIISTECQSEVLSRQIHKVTNMELSDYGVLVPSFNNKIFDINDLEFEQADYILAEAMEKLSMDKDLNKYYRKKSVERIKDFSPDIITKQWIQIIENTK